MDIQWLGRHRPGIVAAAVVLPLAWCLTAAQFRTSITASTDALVLVVLVVAVAVTGDRIAGLSAAVSGGLWFDYFLTAPFNRFTIDDSNDIEVTVLLVVVGIVVTELGLWGRRQQAQASRRAGYLDGVVVTSKIVAGQFSLNELGGQVATHLTDLLDVDSCRFVADGSVPSHAPVLDIDGEVRANGKKLDVDRNGLPVLEETILVAQHHGVRYGQFLITAATRVSCPNLEQRRVAVLLADQVGAAYATQTPGRSSR